ncbi:MAG: TonB-dependent receptor [Gammaproteobacteria bacterium]|nr:TonB-dependent receptor [Gammaproteobacteria bacterium]
MSLANSTVSTDGEHHHSLQLLTLNDNALDTIEVIAEHPSTGEVVHEEFTGSHQRIPREELQRRDITVSDILAHEAGVQSRQMGGFGAFSSFTVRAASAAQTGVYLDGVLLNSAGNAVVDLSMLELMNIESIDVYRGASPAQLGFGSIGGAINLRSPTVLREETSTIALLGVGSFNTQQAQLLHRSRSGAWDVVGAFSLQQSDNDYSFLDSAGTPLNADDDTQQNRHNAQVRRVSGLARAGIQWSAQSRSDVTLQTTQRELGVPEWRNAENNEAELVSDNLQLQLTHTIDSIGDWNSRHTAYWHAQNELFDDSLAQVGLGAKRTDSENQTKGLLSYWEHIGSARTSSVSMEVREETKLASDLLATQFNYRVQRQSVNASVQSVSYHWNDRLMIVPAIRWQSHQNRYDRITGIDSAERSAGELSPSLGVRYSASNTLSARANLGRYYREPSFDELFASRGLYTGNSDLAPEEGLNADIGIHWQPTESLELDSSVFASWRDELISTVYDARGIGRTINLGKAQILGVELSANWSITPTVSMRANVTVQDAKSLLEFDAFDGKQLPGEAQQSAYFRLQRTQHNTRVFIETDGAWNRFYDQANVLPAKDRWVQNLGVDWHRGRWTISGALTNLTDQNVEDFNGLPRPGRSFSLSITTEL